jgi:hypothetical protein
MNIDQTDMEGGIGYRFDPNDLSRIIEYPLPKSETLQLIESINSLVSSISALVEQNQMLIQAMAGEEGVEEVDRYQTL